MKMTETMKYYYLDVKNHFDLKEMDWVELQAKVSGSLIP